MIKQKPKALIFDIFGVLCDSFNTKWEKENLDEGTREYEQFIALRNEIDLGTKTQPDYYLLAGKVSNKSPEEIKQKMESGFTVNKKLFEIIRSLKKNYKVAVCSSSGAVFVRDIFKKSGFVLEDLFDDVVISSEVGLLKPNPQICTLCAERMSLRPEECVFIDDRVDNIRSAESVGMTGYVFSNTASFEQWLEKEGLEPMGRSRRSRD